MTKAMQLAMLHDPDLLRAYLEIVGLLATPDDVFARPGVAERVLTLGAGAPPHTLPGPSRVELLDTVRRRPPRRRNRTSVSLWSSSQHGRCELPVAARSKRAGTLACGATRHRPRRVLRVVLLHDGEPRRTRSGSGRGFGLTAE
jgi:hypothetical protein